MPTRMPLIDSRMTTGLADFFPGTCTIRYSTENQESDGSVDDPLWRNLTGCVDMNCRIAPNAGKEVKAAKGIYTVGSHTILLDDYYSTIKTEMVAVVNLITYDILDIGFDAEHKTTRLQAQVVT